MSASGTREEEKPHCGISQEAARRTCGVSCQGVGQTEIKLNFACEAFKGKEGSSEPHGEAVHLHVYSPIFQVPSSKFNSEAQANTIRHPT